MTPETEILLARAERAIAEAKRLCDLNLAWYETVRVSMDAFWLRPLFERAQSKTYYPQDFGNVHPGCITPGGGR